MSPSNLIDTRGPRFAATITMVVLAVVLLTKSPWLLLAQSVIFALGARFGPQRAPYGLLYRYFVKQRLAPASKFEDVKPPQFAQAVGTVFGVLGLLGVVIGLPALFLGAVAAAFAAAFLNSVFGYCLGCEMYLLVKRASHQVVTSRAFAAK
jgi:hypothetical protein